MRDVIREGSRRQSEVNDPNHNHTKGDKEEDGNCRRPHAQWWWQFGSEVGAVMNATEDCRTECDQCCHDQKREEHVGRVSNGLAARSEANDGVEKIKMLRRPRINAPEADPEREQRFSCPQRPWGADRHEGPSVPKGGGHKTERHNERDGANGGGARRYLLLRRLPQTPPAPQLAHE
mmetsp:Transcript_9168/g.25136  ORF Transcript_9168/g.25136 Transcript_9168/m.25136 type:complete len:177 (-) Transcript_9168:27-557(-)